MIIEDRKTDTTIFLMPVLGINKDKMEEHIFIDAFLDDISKEPHYENSIYILFKPSDVDQFQEWLEVEKERYPEIVDDYDYAGGYVVIVYKFPAELVPDMQLVLEGKYSLTSMNFKKRFSQVKKIITESGLRRDAPSLQWMVFKKASSVREEWEKELDITLSPDDEVWGKPNMEREVLDIEQLKEKDNEKI